MVSFTKEQEQDRRELLASVNEISYHDHLDNVAFQHLCDNLEELEKKSEEGGIKETDLIFLKEIMDNSIVKNLVKIHDTLEILSDPVSLGNERVVDEIISRCSRSLLRETNELVNLLQNPHLRAIIKSHDIIGEKRISSNNCNQQDNNSKENLCSIIMTGEAIRMVGVRKKPGEPLGLTVELDDNTKQLVVARILEGGTIDKQGLLHEGDVILDVNGIAVYTPEELQTEVTKSKDSVTLKIGAKKTEKIHETHASIVTNGTERKNGLTRKLTCYMRALFAYDPEEDTLLPCKEIGLKFDRGDILQIVDQKDPNWWQAKKISSGTTAGLIPSPELEERRKAFVAPEADFVHKIGLCGTRTSKKKKKIIYRSKSNVEFDKAELLLYEEVTKMPPFKRKTLVLIGTQGVGKRTLKNRLVNSDPDRFSTAVPWTSRPPRVLEENGQTYWFTDRETMENEIKYYKFLEYGEYNGHLYGTHLDSVREIIKQGKMCVLDCGPTALKILHNSTEFLPYVIFIAAPGMEQLKSLYDISKSNSNLRYSSKNLTFERQSSIRYSSRRARTLESLASLYEEDDLKKTLEESASMQRTYDKYIDLVIPNNDFDVTFREIERALESLSTEHQWVPVNWIY